MSTLEENAFRGLSSIFMLDLSKLALTTIPANAFTSLTQVVYLDLSNNALTTIASNAFTDCRAVTKLVLSGNGISSLPAEVRKSRPKFNEDPSNEPNYEHFSSLLSPTHRP